MRKGILFDSHYCKYRISTPLELRERQNSLTDFKSCDGAYPVTSITCTYNPKPVIFGNLASGSLVWQMNLLKKVQ
ncbi:7975_t:CDS:2 [Funneliformis caledonium]|uniref:7975_t:CDS:1 n=1 Tax=Funneliformis caledonium TaxID=1117310 RepID=A0A9N9FWB1_9GLOM|nr:7975_t:CDS:2 [Funneliformis caledonium]